MEELFQIHKIICVFYLLLNSLLSISQNSHENHIYFSLPYENGAFKLLGVVQVDSCYIVSNISKSRDYLYMNFTPTICKDYYLCYSINNQIKRSVKKGGYNNRSVETVFRLAFSPYYMEYLTRGMPDFPKNSINDENIDSLLIDNSNMFKRMSGEYSHFLQKMYDERNLSFYKSTSRLIFLLMEMSIFEFNQTYIPYCSSNEAPSTPPLRLKDKKRIIYVAIPISPDLYEKYSFTLQSHYYFIP